MVQAPTGKRVVLVVVASAVIVGVLSNGSQAAPPTVKTEETCDSGSSNNNNSILSIFAREAFKWSTTPALAPLSATVVLAQEILADKSSLPSGLDHAVLTALDDDGTEQVLDVLVTPVRDVVSARVLHEVRQLCGSSLSSPSGVSCDPNETDPAYGTTPLHLAELWGSRDLVDYLLSIGANPELYDSAGRQPRDRAFKHFAASRKREAETRLAEGANPDERCEIPEVIIPLFPDVATDKTLRTAGQTAAVNQWRISSNAALSDVRRLVSEGVPVMTRNAVPYLLADAQELAVHHNASQKLQYHDAATFTESWGYRTVDVGSVSYAKNFEASKECMTLKDYVTASKAASAAPAETTSGKYYTRAPHYVSQMDPDACVEGRDILGRFVEAAMPSSGYNPIVCPPPSGLLGMMKVQYYQGEPWSGAPFHMHSDALNVVVAGKKKWLWVAPRDAVWTRRHIQEYTGEEKGRPWKDFSKDKAASVDSDDVEGHIMECAQHGGDVMYIAQGWGHASMNVQDGTFGYTMGLLNLRDSLGSVLGFTCEH